MQYSDQWRTCRKLVHQYFMEQMVVKHHVKTVNAEAVQMIRDIMVSPDGHMRHPKRFSNSVIMSLSTLFISTHQNHPSNDVKQSTALAPLPSKPSTW
jgi:hypothetical protein